MNQGDFETMNMSTPGAPIDPGIPSKDPSGPPTHPDHAPGPDTPNIPTDPLAQPITPMER
ncbi:MAG: hypothetical protein ABIR28_07950 [Vicinamibacteria bacterium]